MNYFSNVKIPVFGADAIETSYSVPSESSIAGKYFSDDNWLSENNYTRKGGVIEGIARSTDYNTVMRQCSMMSSLLANILAYRNSLSPNPYNQDANAPIGTELVGSEANLNDHIGNLSDIFSVQNFLANGEVTTRTIANNAVTTPKISDSAVTTAKISNDAITVAKLGSGLISTGSASANGISVSLSQRGDSGNRSFVIGLNSTKVDSAAQSDNSTNAQNLKTAPLSSSNFTYLCGVTTNDSNVKPVYHTPSVYISNQSQLNANSFNVMSDERLKENIVDVGKHQVKNLVENTGVKLYNYKDSPNFTTVGLIAQDIKKSNSPLSDLLVFDDGEYYGVHESKLVYVLWNYAQQLNQRVSDLEKSVKELISKK